MEKIDRLVRMRELVGIVSMSRANIYRMVKQGKFPKWIKLAERTSAWRLSEIEAWIKDKENVDNPR